jgi:hypothetical protein
MARRNFLKKEDENLNLVRQISEMEQELHKLKVRKREC